MKYPYKVKVNGEYYAPNTEIPEETPVETVETPVETSEGTEQKEKKTNTKKATKK